MSIKDVAAIRTLIERQFASLSWKLGKQGDWASFSGDFFPDAALYPSARPAKRQSVEDFVRRMASLAQDKLKTFQERGLGSNVQVFGNVAIAAAACEIIENESTSIRGVEMLLLVKDGGRWRIVAQAWDTESEERRIPPALLES